MDSKTLYYTILVALGVALVAGSALFVQGNAAVREDAWYLPVLFIMVWVTRNNMKKLP